MRKHVICRLQINLETDKISIDSKSIEWRCENKFPSSCIELGPKSLKGFERHTMDNIIGALSKISAPRKPCETQKFFLCIKIREHGQDEVEAFYVSCKQKTYSKFIFLKETQLFFYICLYLR